MTLAEVAAMVAKPYGVSVGDLCSPDISGSVRRARTAYYYYARRLTEHSWKQITRYVNREDHSSAIRSVRRFHERRTRG